MKKRTKIGAVACAVALLPVGYASLPAGASDAQECTVERLPLPDGVTEAKLVAGDPAGRYLVGRAQDSDAALAWQDGEVSTLPGVPEGLQFANGSGELAGTEYRDGNETFDAWRYQNGEATVLPKPKDYETTFATAIDSAGNIVGYGRDLQSAREYVALYWPAEDPEAVHMLQDDDGVANGLMATDISDDGRVIGWGEYDAGIYRRGYVWPDVDSEPQPLLHPKGRHRSLPGHISGPWVTGDDGTQNYDPQGLLWNLDTGETVTAEKTLNLVNSDGDVTFKEPWPGVVMHRDGTKATLPGLAEDRPRYIRVLLDRGHEITAAGYAKDDQPGWQPVVWRGC